MKTKRIIILSALLGSLSIFTVGVSALTQNENCKPETTADVIVTDIEDIIGSEVNDIQALANDAGMGISSFAGSAAEIISRAED